MKKAKLTIDKISLDLPIIEGSEKEKAISQDDLKKHTSEIQKITDDYIKKIEEIALAKKNEILKV